MQSVFTFISPPALCEYLRDRQWQLEYEVVGQLTPAEYMDRLKRGWRRFGFAMFRPACPSCRMCQTLRVPVATFRPSRSQRRAWTANIDALSLQIGAPASSDEKVALRDAFQCYQATDKGWPQESADYDETFVENPFPTEEWCYYLGDRLIAVGYVDRLPEGLSAIYFYYDPRERHRSLGTFNVLAVIAAARARDLPHAYLGYYVEGCRSLEYKARFSPNEVLLPTGEWHPFSARRAITR